ncbi:hypothetical protein Pedsa_2164 [Pseudopedobacter saltans DSM 12145]|uniref:Peptidase S74 domain-containing protein n=1 Tax=Pseudopedobacter saltans (strain ATCC 51119 / DSM 12145 / JCM 21818 / CCUG 39354 / LMG 10337 / NBRC 100064 / NCIMB 13643) TaxID=762903 RepID=F0SBM5_PSESL|nr:tail fiber domain-containing protein [Pseudopedobacter saltans]ADY52716.1 hypothetical protein Pedsa_2164 [Pseudopedobacter saltans DSM 12145]
MQKIISKLYLVMAFLLITNLANAQSISENDLKLAINKIENPTSKLKSLQAVTFKYNVDKYKYLKLPQGNQYGFLVENVEQVFPAMVYESSSVYNINKGNTKVAKYKEVNKDDLIPVLVEALKEQQEQLDALKKELQELKSKRG